MQSKNDLEFFYKQYDPWGYRNNPDDKYRKELILSLLNKKYERALDVGAGEGWITGDLPAKEIHAIEISDTAASRFPDNVTRVFEPKGTYDLVIACGVFYDQYEWKQMHQWITESATDTIVTCNIDSWEHRLPVPKNFKLVTEVNFPYREYLEHLCLYRRQQN